MMSKSFITDDGCRIAYEFRVIGDAPVLVLSPSLGTTSALFAQQVTALNEHFSLLLYDPRGHGASDAPLGGYSLDRLGRDVLELLDHLNIVRAHFAGVSLGGMTGQWLGYRAPKRIDKLIIANSSAYMGPPSAWAERIEAVRKNGMKTIVEQVLQRWLTPSFLASNASEIAAVRHMLEATKPDGYAGCSAAIRDMDLRMTASLIEASTLVIAGLRDPATPPVHAEFLAEFIPSAELLCLDAAHLSNVEQPIKFSNAIIRFLKG